MRTTIMDIARLSGFSKSTVSRVLMNDPKVKPETRDKILGVMKSRDYTRSELARSLVKGNIPIVLIIAGDISNYFYAASVKAMEHALDEGGYMSVVCNSEYNAAKELRYLEMAKECKFAGVILMTVIETPELRRQLANFPCPAVLMNRYLRGMEADAVVQDNRFGAYLATKYLIGRGHKKILHLTGIKGSSTADERRRGYEEAMREAGLSVTDAMQAEGDLTTECGYRFGMSVDRKKGALSAIIINNDMMTLGFLQACAERKIGIPEDISVICFDYTPVFEQTSVRITTVGTDAAVLGKAAAKLLVERIGGCEGAPRREVFMPSLSERQSVREISLPRL